MVLPLHAAKGYGMYSAIKFYVSDHGNSGLLLHRIDCSRLPAKEGRTFIGSCYSLLQALSVAKRSYKGVMPCPYCATLPEINAAESDASVLLNTARKPQKK